MDHQEQVKLSLENFLKSYVKDVNLSLIDEILIDYVVRVLDDLVNAEVGEGSFDSESFYEMMCAYLPAFSQVSSKTVCNWLLGVTDQMRSEKKNGSKDLNIKPCFDEDICCTENTQIYIPPASNGVAIALDSLESPKISETIEIDLESDFKSFKLENSDYQSEIQILLEMFPTSCSSEVSHCISACSGDMNQAVHMLLHRQDSGESLSYKRQLSNGKKKNDCNQDDNAVKQQIIAKYSYIDQADDAREHRPPPMKTESKKLVRYRDNKIVSMKGEKFTEIQKEESEDLKKTYVNLKPAKKYRFH